VNQIEDAATRKKGGLTHEANDAFRLAGLAIVGGSVALVKSETTCPPGQHIVQGRKYGDHCLLNRGPAASAAATCLRHRVLQTRWELLNGLQISGCQLLILVHRTYWVVRARGISGETKKKPRLKGRSGAEISMEKK